MTGEEEIFECLGSSKYGPDLVDPDELESVSRQLHRRDGKTYIKCRKREKELVLKPEEIIRQWFLCRLVKHYQYTLSRIRVEHPIKMGAATKKADIAILNSEDSTVVDLIVELKKPDTKRGREQLKSYCNATGAPVGVWTNGNQITYFRRKDPNIFEEITDIPGSNESLANILVEKYTLKELIINDKIANQRKSLREVIIELEDEVFANSGEDVFEEVFKLIFIKLFDEYSSASDKAVIDHHVKATIGEAINYDQLQECVAIIENSGFRTLQFRNRGEQPLELRDQLQELFEDAKITWQGIFRG